MWVMQNDVLLKLPDDAPLPPKSRVVEVPEDFQSRSARFRIENGELKRMPASLRVPDDKLTTDEVRQLKELLASRKTQSKEQK